MADDLEDPWERHSRVQRQAWLALSYRERLDWLWQAKLFAARAQGSAKKNANLMDLHNESLEK